LIRRVISDAGTILSAQKLKFLQLNPHHAHKFLSNAQDIDLISAILAHSIEPLQ